MLIPTDPDATRVEFTVPGVGLVAVLADGSVEHPVVTGETLHEPDDGEPYVEVHTKLETDKTGRVLDGVGAAESLVRAGVLRVAPTKAQPKGSATDTPEKEV